MGNRLTKIYTRTGDDGTTGMADGSRISKADLVFIVMGDVDELNAHIGMIIAHCQHLKSDFDSQSALNSGSETETDDNKRDKVNNLLQSLSVVQHLLFNIGGELAMPEYQGITESHLTWLESQIDDLNQTLPALKDFILPAGSVLVSQTHIARTVCRRAERQAVSLKQTNAAAISSTALKLLNRLSDWLFVLSRYCAKLEQSEEVLWDKNILEKLETNL